MQNHFDVLIVGAGLSGIGAAVHLQKNLPGKTYAILEGRERLGGTWDLFRYPGIRSDSDMFTLGYNFKPWTDPKAIADGPSIRRYITETAKENNIEKHIRYGHMVKHSNFDSKTATWTVDVEVNGELQQVTANDVIMCAGYYNYAEGYRPEFPGEANFKGEMVHPQFWPEDFDYSGKKVVIIGSGATAMTLVPSMAKDAAHVTMLQRSPTYIVSRPAEDTLANRMRAILPAKLAYAITRLRAISMGSFFYNISQKRPAQVRKFLLDGVKQALGPDVDMKHYKPTYNPWDQRVCLVPDGDLFKSIKKGDASVVTDHIETFTENGITLKSGETLEADIVITATGLNMQLMGGMAVSVDGVEKDLTQSFTYKGMMLSDVPNMAFVIGYTNASWTLKADLTSDYFCRLLSYKAKKGYTQMVPRVTKPMEAESLMGLQSGYVERGAALLPKQGAEAPWKVYQNYFKDKLMLGYGSVVDENMEFSDPTKGAATAPQAMAAE